MELTQIDTFYNGLNDNDQDSLNAAAGGNLLSKTTREALNIIGNKSKVCYSRNKSNVSKMNSTSRESSSKTDERINKLADQISTLVEIVSKKVVTPATVKAVEESCVTCGSAYAWYNCPNIDNNQSNVCTATGTYNQVAPPNRVSNHMAPPSFAPVQNNGQNSVVDFEADPRVPLILGRSFLRTGRALIDVYEGELILRDGDEWIGFLKMDEKPFKRRGRKRNGMEKESSSKTDERIDKLADQISTLVEIVFKKVVTPATVKAVEEICVTCGSAHAWYNCPNTDNNQSSVCAATGTYNRVAPPNRVSTWHHPVLLRCKIVKIGFQNQPFQVPNNQVQKGVPNEFSNYMIFNDQIMRNMQSQINSLKGEFKNETQNTMKTQQTVLMNQQNAFQNNLQNMLSGFFQNQASTSGTLPSNTISNPKCEMKAITTRSGVAYEGPLIPTNPSPKKVVKRETEETTDKEQNNFQGSTAHIPPLVNPIPIPEPDVSKTLPKPIIPYPLRLNDQTFAPTINNFLMNKKKLFELAKIPLNENCSTMLLKKLPEKLGDPGKFLIPCDFPGMDVCHALADLGASINLMPLFIWKKISLPELTPTRMTLELADGSITCPKGLTEDVFVKVGKFHFPTDFVVVDFEADPRVPLILGRSFLRTGRALIDVYEGELILRDGDERLIFHVDKHPQKHANESIKMINFIDVSCKDSFGEFADELALLDPFPPGNEDVDFEADLREIELLLNQDPSIDFSPKITINPNPERFTDEPALACLPPSGDDNDDKSFLKEDVQEENFQVYSNPLFEFDDNYNSSDINPLFNEILEDVERKDSNVSNFDEPVLLNTPLFDEDECFDPGGEIDKIDAFMDAYNDSEGDVLEILHNTTHNLFPEVFFDHEPQGLKDEPDNDDLMTEDKVFDPGVMEKIFSPSYVRLSSKDRHYLFFTIVFSFGSEDTIFDPGIYAFHFSSLEPVAFESQMEVCSSTCFSPMNN
ncbi:reverse transcriptase domain-containing protein [Tanacetum coccineum]